MNLAEAKALGLKHKSRKRVGRGIGSGHGKTSGKGHKGAKARSGWSSRIGWEGGQMPLYRRIPKRGFNNKEFKRTFTIVNVGQLDGFDDGATVDLQAVLATGLVRKERHTEMFKILGDGELTKRLTVHADAISASARTKIESRGGTVEIRARQVYRPKFVRKDGSKSQPGRASRPHGKQKP